MTLAAKGLVGLGSIAAVASAAVPATIFFTKKSPFKAATLTNYRTGNYKGKYSNYFGKHFVTAAEVNKHWWDKSYERLTEQKKQPNTLSSSFNAVNEAFGNSSTNSLNKLCETYHSKTYAEITAGSQNGKPSTIQDFWKFCTTVEAEIELVGSSVTEKTIGKKYKDTLIAAGEGKNKKFWDTQEEIFFDTPQEELPSSENSSLRALYNIKNQGSRMSLREVCEEAYKSSESEKQKFDKVDKFCSITGITQN